MKFTPAELRTILGDQYEETVRKSKYRSQKVELDGFHFDSKLEAKRYTELQLMVQACELVEVLVHTPTIRLRGTSVTYTLDFLCVAPDGSCWAEDVKGIQTQAWKVKWRISRAQHPGLDMRYLVKAKGGGWDVRTDA